jgi:integrase/recombinase XerC
MDNSSNYSLLDQKENVLRLREIISTLPDFCKEFFIGIEPTTSIRSRIGYAYDLNIFFNYIISNFNIFSELTYKTFTLDHLTQVDSTHIELFLDFLTYYSKNSDQSSIYHHNSNTGKARKLAALRSLFNYFFKKKKLPSNPSLLVDMPKIHEKPITRLEIDEVVKLLDLVETGEGLTEKQKKYHNFTKCRDLALITLLLGTGIRVSECVGLNLSDLNFEVNGFKITRKGGNEVILYFGQEVRSSLLEYITERNALGHDDDALFLSLQKKRISTRAVQNLVKKYSTIITNLKKISPHKLRSTFGTNLYRETGDIYLVADVLGHRDVNTTKKHYAAMSEDQRKRAAKIVKLRD